MLEENIVVVGINKEEVMVGIKASEEEHKKVESKEGDCKLEDCTEELRMQEGCKEVGHKPEERKPEVEHTQTTST